MGASEKRVAPGRWPSGGQGGRPEQVRERTSRWYRWVVSQPVLDLDQAKRLLGALYQDGDSFYLLAYADKNTGIFPTQTRCNSLVQAAGFIECGFRPSRSAIPADADHPFRQGDHPGRDAAG